MARIPRISPSGNTITTQTPGQPIRKGDATGEVLETLGKATSDIFDQLQRAALVAEKTKAQNNLDQTIIDIESRVSQETDFSQDKQQNYRQEIEDAIGNSSRFINMPEERSLFEQNARTKAKIAESRVNGTFRKKIIENGRQDLDNFFANKQQEYILSKTPGEKAQVILERDEKLAEAVAAGYIQPSDAQKMQKDLTEKWEKARVDNDISSDPEGAAARIRAGFYDLTAKQESEALGLAKNLAERRQKEAQRQSDVEMQETERSLYKALQEGTASLAEINDAEARGSIGMPGGIRQDVAADLRRLVTEFDEVTEQQKAERFIELQDQFVALDIKSDDSTDSSLDEIAQFRFNVLSAMAKGEIRQTTGETWLKNTSIAFEETADAEVAKDNPKGINFKKRFDRGGWKAVLLWVDGFDPEEKEILKKQMMEDVMARVANGEDELKAVQQTIESVQRSTNPNRNNYEIDDIIPTPSGSYKVVDFDVDGEPLLEPVNAR